MKNYKHVEKTFKTLLDPATVPIVGSRLGCPLWVSRNQRRKKSVFLRFFFLLPYAYGSFHGRLTVKFFFSTKQFFLPFYFENNRHVFFFQCDT